MPKPDFSGIQAHLDALEAKNKAPVVTGDAAAPAAEAADAAANSTVAEK